MAKPFLFLSYYFYLFSLFFVLKIDSTLAFRCPDLKTPKCACDVLKSKNVFVVTNEDKGLISCTGSGVDDVFLHDYSHIVVESNSYCQDDDPFDNENEIESESRTRRTAIRAKDRTQGLLSSLGPAQCTVSRLSLNRTSIRSLNGSILSNVYLEEIRLIHNTHLELLDLQTFNLSRHSLKTLEISHAKIPFRQAISFASFFEHLEVLKVLLGVESLDKFTFARGEFMHLKELDLSDNQISKIADYSFFELPNLRVLRLTRNNLHAVPPHMLTFAPPSHRLVNSKLHLLIDHNRLSSDLIDARAFTSFLRPVTLDLSYNNLHTLPEKPFRTFLFSDHRNTIDVRGNAFLCEEDTKWITKHVLYLNYSRGGIDEDVNPEYRTEIIGDLTFLYERTKPDYSFYKIREMMCQNNRSIFATA